jgi:hypothetical protein
VASPNPPTSRPPEQLDGRPTPESAEGEKGAATLRLNSEAAKVPKHTGDADGISRRQALLAEAAAAQLLLRQQRRPPLIPIWRPHP